MPALLSNRRAIALVAAVSIVAAGCRARIHMIDTVDLANNMGDWLKEQGVLTKSCTCPTDQPDIIGTTKFECTCIDDDDVPIVFSAHSDPDFVNFDLKDGLLVNKAKMGHAIEGKPGHPTLVKCPDKMMIIERRTYFTCDSVLDGEAHTVLFTRREKGNGLDWWLKD